MQLDVTPEALASASGQVAASQGARSPPTRLIRSPTRRSVRPVRTWRRSGPAVHRKSAGSSTRRWAAMGNFQMAASRWVGSPAPATPPVKDRPSRPTPRPAGLIPRGPADASHRSNTTHAADSSCGAPGGALNAAQHRYDRGGRRRGRYVLGVSWPPSTWRGSLNWNRSWARCRRRIRVLRRGVRCRAPAAADVDDRCRRQGDTGRSGTRRNRCVL